MIPAYNEGDGDRRRSSTASREGVTLPYEVLVVVDDAGRLDGCRVEEYARRTRGSDHRERRTARGPANAIRFGIDHAAAPVAVVTMADGSDDPRQIDDLTRLVERGVVVAAASRYMPGGQQVGGPRS